MQWWLWRELRTENRSLTRKWRPLTCVLFQTLPLMGRNRNICRKYRMHRSGRWQNGLWRKDSVPNLTHREICHWAMAVHPFSVVATGRRWPAVTPAIFGRRNIIWDITFMAVIWRMAVYRFWRLLRGKWWLPQQAAGNRKASIGTVSRV